MSLCICAGLIYLSLLRSSTVYISIPTVLPFTAKSSTFKKKKSFLQCCTVSPPTNNKQPYSLHFDSIRAAVETLSPSTS